MIDVVVVDDHPVVRRGVTDLLAGADDIQVVGEASSGTGAVALAISERPQVVVMDLTMPYDDNVPATRTSATGLDAIGEIRKQLGADAPGIVVLSVHGEIDVVRAALTAGASGYVLKESVTSDLPTAVRAADSRAVYLSAELAVVLAAPPPRHEDWIGSRLSPRERDVVRLIVNGLSTKDIAAKLYTSPKTVEKQRRDAMRKLGVTNVASLVRTALEADLLDR